MEDPLERLVHLLKSAPGIGDRSARRIAHFILRSSSRYVRELANALMDVKESIKQCHRCGNLGKDKLCEICADSKRNRKIICVVSSVQDLHAIETAGAYSGTYFVLHATFSPLEGTGPEELKIDELRHLIESEGISEVILAMNPNADGEATASLIASQLKEMQVKITRIASGIPHGGEIEFADPVSIESAIKGRHEY